MIRDYKEIAKHLEAVAERERAAQAAGFKTSRLLDLLYIHCKDDDCKIGWDSMQKAEKCCSTTHDPNKAERARRPDKERLAALVREICATDIPADATPGERKQMHRKVYYQVRHRLVTGYYERARR